MSRRPPHSTADRRFSRLAMAVAVSACCGAVALAGGSFKETMTFAAAMAKDGNWREARYRWQQLVDGGNDNPRLLNNLAVALEAIGLPEEAGRTYARALAQTPADGRIEENRRRSERFWRAAAVRGAGSALEEGATEVDDDARAPDASDGEPDRAKGKGKGKGKGFRVAVEMPVPARLELSGDERLLVADFKSNENVLLDVSREIVRFVRSELSKRSELHVLEVTPAPAIPEQTREDLLANREFWKYLGREYDAELVVFGIAEFDRSDYSSFRDVDMISPATGQKVRRSQFVEQERFNYDIEVFFMDGATGTLRFGDRWKRSAIYDGTQNDPLTAFFSLSESISPDLLAIVKPRMRRETRFVFKR